MGAAQSLETLDDMLRCDGCRGSNKDVPDTDIFSTSKPESKDERLARLVNCIHCRQKDNISLSHHFLPR
jgi:hypothetical protein